MKGPFGIAFILGALLIAAVACSAATDDGPPAAAPAPTQPSPAQPSVVEEPAPIESVRINRVAAKPPNASLVVVSGLPNSCYEFGGHTFTRDGDSFDITITNLLTTGPGIACAEIYRTVETTISNGDPSVFFGPIETCKVYDVTVNGELHKVQAIDPSVRCAAPGTEPGGTMSVLAPIESVVINIAESFPPQFFVQVRSGLPNGCAKFGGFEVTQDGDITRIAVTNLVPVDPNTICTQVYGTVENNIPLGSDFVGGTKYTVRVNDAALGGRGAGEATFVAQDGANIPTPQLPPPPVFTPPVTPLPPPTSASDVRLGVPFSVGFDQTAVIESEGLEVRFSAVIEDSRCAANVVCIWAGRAKIQVDVSQNGESLGQHELTLETGMGGITTQTIGDYRIHLSFLDPYPGTTEPIEESGYVAILVVSKATLESPETITVPLGGKFDMEAGQTALIDSEGVEIRFIEVTEDSRCPVDALCIQAGQASVLISVAIDGQDFGPRKLVLDAGKEVQQGHQVSEYLITLLALEPQPGAGLFRIDESRYIAIARHIVATLAVTKVSQD